MWSSDKYIGTGGNQVTFGPGDMVESRIDNNTSVYAVLTVVSGSDYVSELHITANLSSSVTCIATDYNEQNDTIHLRVLGKLMTKY